VRCYHMIPEAEARINSGSSQCAKAMCQPLSLERSGIAEVHGAVGEWKPLVMKGSKWVQAEESGK
jgi:hypothetical protein